MGYLAIGRLHGLARLANLLVCLLNRLCRRLNGLMRLVDNCSLPFNRLLRGLSLDRTISCTDQPGLGRVSLGRGLRPICFLR